MLFEADWERLRHLFSVWKHLKPKQNPLFQWDNAYVTWRGFTQRQWNTLWNASHGAGELVHIFCRNLAISCFVFPCNFFFLLWFSWQSYRANVICPNKHQSDPEKFYKNHLLESETYIGGHVECLESGVFRSDLPTSFKLDPSAYDVSVFLRVPGVTMWIAWITCNQYFHVLVEFDSLFQTLIYLVAHIFVHI